MKKWICLIMLIILLTGCTTQNEPVETAQPQNTTLPCSVDDLCDDEESKDNSFMEAYDIGSQHLFVESSYEEVLNIIENKGSGVFYFGFDTCAWCLEAVPILNEVTLAQDIAVYAIDTRSQFSESEAGMEYKATIVDFLEEYLMSNEEQEKHLYVPNILFLKDGEVVANHVGTLDGHDAKERILTQEEIVELTAIYDGYVQDYLSK